VGDRFLKLLKETIKSFYGADPQQTEWFGRCINARPPRVEPVTSRSRARAAC
jgi:hypothetical protein